VFVNISIDSKDNNTVSMDMGGSAEHLSTTHQPLTSKALAWSEKYLQITNYQPTTIAKHLYQLPTSNLATSDLPSNTLPITHLQSAKNLQQLPTNHLQQGTDRPGTRMYELLLAISF
jgi:hypothetical protein